MSTTLKSFRYLLEKDFKEFISLEVEPALKNEELKTSYA